MEGEFLAYMQERFGSLSPIRNYDKDCLDKETHTDIKYAADLKRDLLTQLCSQIINIKSFDDSFEPITDLYDEIDKFSRKYHSQSIEKAYKSVRNFPEQLIRIIKSLIEKGNNEDVLIQTFGLYTTMEYFTNEFKKKYLYSSLAETLVYLIKASDIKYIPLLMKCLNMSIRYGSIEREKIKIISHFLYLVFVARNDSGELYSIFEAGLFEFQLYAKHFFHEHYLPKLYKNLDIQQFLTLYEENFYFAGHYAINVLIFWAKFYPDYLIDNISKVINLFQEFAVSDIDHFVDLIHLLLTNQKNTIVLINNFLSKYQWDKFTTIISNPKMMHHDNRVLEFIHSVKLFTSKDQSVIDYLYEENFLQLLLQYFHDDNLYHETKKILYIYIIQITDIIRAPYNKEMFEQYIIEYFYNFICYLDKELEYLYDTFKDLLTLYKEEGIESMKAIYSLLLEKGILSELVETFEHSDFQVKNELAKLLEEYQSI